MSKNMFPRLFFLILLLLSETVFAAQIEVLQACVLPKHRPINREQRQQAARCLAWVPETNGICLGHYYDAPIRPLSDPKAIQIEANEISFSERQRSTLRGGVKLRRQDQMLQANTAYIERDPKTKKIKKIHLLGDVKLASPIGMVRASQTELYPSSQRAEVDNALYRVEAKRRGALLPAWGYAKKIRRFSGGQVYMKKASFTYCAPLDSAWDITASDLYLDKKSNVGRAKNATLHFYNFPVFYTPYLTFPLTKERKSGFLMPIIGTTSIGGFDLAAPYYLNLAPNYDATVIPHYYSKRGVMVGGEFRYLSRHNVGVFQGDFLSHDRAYKQFLNQNLGSFPASESQSSSRWSARWINDSTLFLPNLKFNADVRSFSDSYYLQDFTTNLAQTTDRQILRKASVDYTTDHWLLKGEVHNYQTLHPVNEPPISDIYNRLPRLLAKADYPNLPLDGQFEVLGTLDAFLWPDQALTPNPDATRYHVNPKYTLNKTRAWGYFKPAVEWVGNAYNYTYPANFPNPPPLKQHQITVPRYSVDSGLYFERQSQVFGKRYRQVLEPRLYYLNVPYQNQSRITVFDSAYMIFSTKQVFRDNRFSGFDRIGDANQLGYGLTAQWLDADSGVERASLAVAQLRYFADRRVNLCYSPTGNCQDTNLFLGYLSPTAKFSPIATHGIFWFGRYWSLVADYVWNPATSGTNNGQATMQYIAPGNRIFYFGYSFFVDGDNTQVDTAPNSTDDLNQASVSVAWPLNDHWSGLGSYGYNISKNYQMKSLLGVQYDSCCWGARLIGGQTLRSLQAVDGTQYKHPQYTSSIFFQLFLKGLGTVGNSDPSNTLRTYLPGYVDTFKT